MQETWVQYLGWEDPLEKEMATHSSFLAWKIPWTEEPGRLQSMGSQRVGYDWATSLPGLWACVSSWYEQGHGKDNRQKDLSLFMQKLISYNECLSYWFAAGRIFLKMIKKIFQVLDEQLLSIWWFFQYEGRMSQCLLRSTFAFMEAEVVETKCRKSFAPSRKLVLIKCL